MADPRSHPPAALGSPRPPLAVRGFRWASWHYRRRSRRLRRSTRKLAKRLAKATWRELWRSLDARHRPTYARTLAAVPSRDELPIVLNRRGLVGTAVEVGVQTGRYSEFFLRHWDGAKLISVDPWASDDADAYVDRANVDQDEQERLFEVASGRLRAFGKRSEIWRMTSLEAAVHVAPQSLDFVYIDARHDFDSVTADLVAWYPKLRPGGIIAGHDYVDGRLVQGEFGVKSAVDAFFAPYGLTVHATEGREPAEMFPSWLVEVPRTAP